MTTASKNPVQWLCEKLAEQKDSAKNLPYPDEARYGGVRYSVNGVTFINQYVSRALQRIYSCDKKRTKHGFQAAGVTMNIEDAVYRNDWFWELEEKVNEAGITPSKAENRDALDCLIAFLTKALPTKITRETLERKGRLLLKKNPNMTIRTVAKCLNISKTMVGRLDCWKELRSARERTEDAAELAKLVAEQKVDDKSRRVRG